jgi:hypothetical protein
MTRAVAEAVATNSPDERDTPRKVKANAASGNARGKRLARDGATARHEFGDDQNHDDDRHGQVNNAAPSHTSFTSFSCGRVLDDQHAGLVLALVAHHRVARRRFRERVTATVNATIEEVVDYEVSFAELGNRLAAPQR